MTRDDVMRLSQDAGVPLNFTMYRNGPIGAFTMVEFMTLMEAAYAAGQSAEREACAQVCDEQTQRWVDDRARYCASECAAAIRARGQA